MGRLQATMDEAQRARQDRKAAGKSNFNADKTRYISREFLGWVCYLGRVGANGEFAGMRAGVTASEADADRWLGGEEIKWDLPADAFGNLVDQSGSQR